jgi:tRNA-dihydrouridine synthase B
MYTGDAEYDTIRAVKQSVSIPVIANGDITTPEKARFVLEYTGADAVMIGRAAQGRPWIFREIAHFLETGTHLPPPSVIEIREVMVEHLHDLYAFYGKERGSRVARKHISWYTKGLKNSAVFRARMNTLESAELQLEAVARFFDELTERSARLEYNDEEVALAA